MGLLKSAFASTELGKNVNKRNEAMAKAAKGLPGKGKKKKAVKKVDNNVAKSEKRSIVDDITSSFKHLF